MYFPALRIVVTNKVAEYLSLIEEQLKPQSEEDYDILLDRLDALWYSMNEAEIAQAHSEIQALIG